MKKVSTVTAKPDKNTRQKLTVGLDLGDSNSWYCMLDESGQIQLENTCHECESVARSFQQDAAQSDCTGNWDAFAWISRLLSELGHEVIVANARKVRLIGESRKKDDRLDAQTLARLAGSIRSCYTGEASQRAGAS